MTLKSTHEHSRPGRWPTWIRIRRKLRRYPGGIAPQPRMWSLLLPPQYPEDRR